MVMVESLNSEGDINSTEERARWQAKLDHQETRKRAKLANRRLYC